MRPTPRLLDDEIAAAWAEFARRRERFIRVVTAPPDARMPAGWHAGRAFRADVDIENHFKSGTTIAGARIPVNAAPSDGGGDACMD
jgi:hypothetical protein